MGQEEMVKLKSLVAIERKKKLDKVYGFLIAQSKHWVLIEGENQFQADGYRVVAKKDIKKVRYNAADKLHESICKRLGVAPKSPPKMDIEEPSLVFQTLKSKGVEILIYV